MAFLIWLLTGPGALLVDAWLAEPTALEDSSETRAALAVLVGAVFWVCVYVALRLGWGAVQRHRNTAAQKPPVTHHPQTQAIDWWRTLALVWGAVWRAQAVHITVHAAIPIVLSLLQGALLIVFMPFSVMGFGDRNLGADNLLDHLAQPSCWTFVTLCDPLHSPRFVVWLLLAAAWIAAWRLGARRAPPPRR